MNEVLHKEWLSETICLMEIHAPKVARERRAGQFIILQADLDFGERIPLTIADANAEKGSLTIVFQVVGRSTQNLARFEVGQRVPALAGPLGTPTHIERFGKVVCVGGGVGTAPLHPIARALKEAGSELTIILGARTDELLILEERMGKLADELIVCTDDGSRGLKARVTEPLKALCASDSPPDLVVAIGPPLMMKYCAETTRPFGIPTVVSLNTIMIDGTGMCGGCRVTVGGETRFVCVDGPEFDGHLVDFDNMIARLGTYREHEEDHVCKTGGVR